MNRGLSVTATVSRKSVLLLALLVVIIYLPVLRDLVVRWWDDPNYSHGFLVPLVAAFLVWRSRADLKTMQAKPRIAGLIVAAVGISLFTVGNAGADYFSVAFSLVVVLFGLTYHLLGPDVIRRIWFAFFILLFMIPIPGVIYYAMTSSMQLLASKVSVDAMQALGMSVLRRGNIIMLPNHSLEVAEACSGLRSLVSLMAMGAFYGYLTQPRLPGKAIVFAASVPIAVASNLVRVFVTALIAYGGNVDPTIEPIHTIMGFSVFIVAFILLAVTGGIVRKVFR